MLISASRRTDIPAFYSDWFFSRVGEGYLSVKNPINFRLSTISLAPDDVEGIIFWTKNPAPMLSRLDDISDYMYIFQFTLTAYKREVEPGLPDKAGLLETFKRLSEIIGADRIIWRYDPILFNEKYTENFHIREFGRLASEFAGYTRKVTISFIDTHYRGVKNGADKLALSEISYEAKRRLGAALAQISVKHGLEICSCAEKDDLRETGISPASCIDAGLFEHLLGRRLKISRQKTQRPQCGCFASVDIGVYNSCPNGCLYCYANYNRGLINANYARHDSKSTILL